MLAWFAGYPLPLQALAWGLLSAASLPVGSALGMLLTPVDGYSVANVIAFGAGCLLFAVTVELYGAELMHLEHTNFHAPVELLTSLSAAVLGAYLYLCLNRWVESLEGESPDEEDPELGEEVEAAVATLERSAASKRGSTEQTSLLRQEMAPAKRRWAKVRAYTKMATLQKQVVVLRHGKVPSDDAGARSLALGMLAGIMADGIPEAVLIGFLVSDGNLSFMLVASLFVANFPESFSSSSLMSEHKAFAPPTILLLWTVPCLLTGLIAALTTYLAPPSVQQIAGVRLFASSIEGVAGGMMLAMVASVMLPQAFNMAKANDPWRMAGVLLPSPRGSKEDADEHHGGDVPGLFCVLGFLSAVGLKVLGGVLGATH